MKDSSKLLGFNPNRKLKFHTFRKVDIPSRRRLLFNIDRDLSFDPQRALPFGKQGVKFRHFVCGGCGTVVDGGAVRCPKCRAVFRDEDRSVVSTSKVSLSDRIEHTRMREHFGDEYIETQRAPARAAPTYRCSSCGKNLRFSRERGKWYCDRCRIFIAPTTRGGPKTVRKYVPRGGAGPSGVKFVPQQSVYPRRPPEVVIVEDINKKKRRQ